MKSYTDLKQSKKLAEFLPIESADMCFNISVRKNMPPLMTPYSRFNEFFDISPTPDFLIPCWSLTALLSVLNTPDLTQTSDGGWFIRAWYLNHPYSVGGVENPVDACVEMIEKLHELKML